jgi:hypothetical protein
VRAPEREPSTTTEGVTASGDACWAAGVSLVCWDHEGVKASRREEARRVRVKTGKTVFFVILILSSYCSDAGGAAWRTPSPDESIGVSAVWTNVNYVGVADM